MTTKRAAGAKKRPLNYKFKKFTKRRKKKYEHFKENERCKKKRIQSEIKSKENDNDGRGSLQGA